MSTDDRENSAPIKLNYLRPVDSRRRTGSRLPLTEWLGILIALCGLALLAFGISQFVYELFFSSRPDDHPWLYTLAGLLCMIGSFGWIDRAHTKA